MLRVFETFLGVNMSATPSRPTPKWWEGNDKGLAARIVKHYGGTRLTALRLGVHQCNVSNWRWYPIPTTMWAKLVKDRVATRRELEIWSRRMG